MTTWQTTNGNLRCTLPNGLLHREDGPAYISKDGSQEWIINGKTHRHDGPAVIWASGKVGWYINGNIVRSSKEYQRLTGLTDEDVLALSLKYGGFRDL